MYIYIYIYICMCIYIYRHVCIYIIIIYFLYFLSKPVRLIVNLVSAEPAGVAEAVAGPDEALRA